MLVEGTKLQNRYIVQSLLGRGGMGAVYRVWDERLQMPMALKELIIPPNYDAHQRDALQHQFQQEALNLARLKHPNLVSVSDYFYIDNASYLVMSLIVGETLEVRIQRAGTLAESQVSAWAVQLLSALAYCHRNGVLHRDIKPSNILIRTDNSAVLVDFGLIKRVTPQNPHTQTVIRGMGTPEYAPLEQYGSQPMSSTDTRSDIYSLGATMYHALTGKEPLPAPYRQTHSTGLLPLQAHNPQISDRMATIVQQAMALNPDHRFASADAMATALQRQYVAPPPPSPSRLRFPVWAWAAAIVLAVIVLGGVAFALTRRADPDPTPEPILVISTQVVTIVTTPTPLPAAMQTATQAVVAMTDVAGAATDVVALVPTDTATPLPTDTPTVVSTPTETPTVTPTPAPVNGLIVFDSTRDEGFPELYSMEPDGSNQQRLTYDNRFSAEADLAVDGRQIAFQVGVGAPFAIHVMQLGERTSTFIVDGAQPAWSPDGRYIAYETNEAAAQTRAYDMATGEDRPITSDSYRNRIPDWSPDGRYIVYMSRRSNDLRQLIIVDVETGQQTQLTHDTAFHAVFPAWSPDGNWIVYNTSDGSWPLDIVVMSADGSERDVLTASGENNGRPAWSPDSQFLVFNSYDRAQLSWSIHRLHIESGERVQMTFLGNDQRANWGR